MDVALSGPGILTGWSIRPAHDLRQLFAGIDSEFGECVVQMGFDGVGRDVQLLCH